MRQLAEVLQQQIVSKGQHASHPLSIFQTQSKSLALQTLGAVADSYIRKKIKEKEIRNGNQCSIDIVQLINQWNQTPKDAVAFQVQADYSDSLDIQAFCQSRPYQQIHAFPIQGSQDTFKQYNQSDKMYPNTVAKYLNRSASKEKGKQEEVQKQNKDSYKSSSLKNSKSRSSMSKSSSSSSSQSERKSISNGKSNRQSKSEDNSREKQRQKQKYYKKRSYSKSYSSSSSPERFRESITKKYENYYHDEGRRYKKDSIESNKNRDKYGNQEKYWGSGRDRDRDRDRSRSRELDRNKSRTYIYRDQRDASNQSYRSRSRERSYYNSYRPKKKYSNRYYNKQRYSRDRERDRKRGDYRDFQYKYTQKQRSRQRQNQRQRSRQHYFDKRYSNVTKGNNRSSYSKNQSQVGYTRRHYQERSGSYYGENDRNSYGREGKDSSRKYDY